MNNESKDLPNRFPGESNENSTISTPQQNRQGVLVGRILKLEQEKEKGTNGGIKMTDYPKLSPKALRKWDYKLSISSKGAHMLSLT